MCCILCRQLHSSQWLDKKVIEQMLTEQLSDEDVSNQASTDGAQFVVDAAVWEPTYDRCKTLVRVCFEAT